MLGPTFGTRPAGHNRRIGCSRSRIVLLTILATSLVGSALVQVEGPTTGRLGAQGLPVQAGNPTFPALFREEADLTTVRFVDADAGWAVGWQGSIWATRDGGRSWEPQTLPRDAHVADVYLENANRGWVIGSVPVPWQAGGDGVLFSTINGGRSWQIVTPDGGESNSRLGARVGAVTGSVAEIPQGPVRLLSAPGGQLWIVGSARRADGASVVRFDPERRTVTAVPSPTDRRIVQATSAPGGALVMLDERGRLTWMDGHVWQDVPLPAGRGRIRAISIGDEGIGLAVGEASTVLRTEDGGRSWHMTSVDGRHPGVGDGTAADSLARPSGDVVGTRPAATQPGSTVTWTAIKRIGGRFVVVGDPGAWMLVSSDRGQTWESRPTGVPTGLSSVEFYDERYGWAVGRLGVIVATRDGGRTWLPQRGTNRQAAILCVMPTADAIPWEILARASAEQGFFTGICPLVVSSGEDEGDITTEPGRLGSLRVPEWSRSSVSASAEPDDRMAFRRQSRAGLATGSSAVGRSLDLAAASFGGHAWGPLHDGSLPPAGWGLSAGGLLDELARKARQRPDVIYETLVEQLAQTIRSVRPYAVIAPAAVRTEADGRTLLVNQIVQAAVERAAERGLGGLTSPGEIPAAALPAWRVRQVVAVRVALSASDELGVHHLWRTHDTLASLGLTASQAARYAESFVRLTPQLRPDVYRGVTLSQRDGRETTRAGLLTDLNLPLGSSCRRSGIGQDRLRLETVLGAPPIRQLRQALAAQPDTFESLIASWSGAETAGRLTAPDAAAWLTAAAVARERGRPLHELTCLDGAVTRFPEHPLVEPAARRLIGLLASAECETLRRLCPDHTGGASSTPIDSQGRALTPTIEDAPDLQAIFRPPTAAERAHRTVIASAEGMTAFAPARLLEMDATEAAKLGYADGSVHDPDGARGTGPQTADGSVEVRLQARRARMARVLEVVSLLHSLTGERLSDPRRLSATDRAQAILAGSSGSQTLPHRGSWDGTNDGVPPLRVGTIRPTERPWLDGRLDDACWSHDPTEPRTSPMFRTDGTFLIFGVTVARDRTDDQVPPEPVNRSPPRRQRDQVNPQTEKIVVGFDADDDPTHQFLITIDRTGRIHDAAAGDDRWNPELYVAVDDQGSTWTIEGAIRLTDLAETVQGSTAPTPSGPSSREPTAVALDHPRHVSVWHHRPGERPRPVAGAIAWERRRLVWPAGAPRDSSGTSEMSRSTDPPVPTSPIPEAADTTDVSDPARQPPRTTSSSNWEIGVANAEGR